MFFKHVCRHKAPPPACSLWNITTSQHRRRQTAFFFIWWELDKNINWCDNTPNKPFRQNSLWPLSEIGTPSPRCLGGHLDDIYQDIWHSQAPPSCSQTGNTIKVWNNVWTGRKSGVPALTCYYSWYNCLMGNYDVKWGGCKCRLLKDAVDGSNFKLLPLCLWEKITIRPCWQCGPVISLCLQVSINIIAH